MFVPKRGGTLAVNWMNSENIHILWVTSGQHSCIDTSIHALLELEYTKAVTLHCAKVRGGIDQGPTTQATYLSLPGFTVYI